ncbi:helix-turn-helix domain-containing protein [Chitinophagaceae bacterium MMS25-I14]
MEIKRLIADRIKEIRKGKELSQEAIAFKAEIDRTFMSHVERGERNISIETLQKILTALEISFAEFFNHENFRKP